MRQASRSQGYHHRVAPLRYHLKSATDTYPQERPARTSTSPKLDPHLAHPIPKDAVAHKDRAIHLAVVTVSKTLFGMIVLFVAGSWPSLSSTASQLAISSALEMTPPAPALNSPTLSSNQKVIRRPNLAQVSVKSPDALAVGRERGGAHAEGLEQTLLHELSVGRAGVMRHEIRPKNVKLGV